jgi:hypothetical protein
VQLFIQGQSEMTAHGSGALRSSGSVLASKDVQISEQISLSFASVDQSALSLVLNMSDVGYSPEKKMCFEWLRQQNLSRASIVGTVLLAPFIVYL